MASNIAIIQGHPDPAGGHLCHALAEAYAGGAAEAGHAVETTEVARVEFPILRTYKAFHDEPPPPAIVAAQEAIARAGHLVFVYPLWHGTMPALTKGFLEQVFREDFAFRHNPRGFPAKLLKGRSARIVVTMGMPALVYRWYFRAHGLKSLERNILGFAGIGPIRETLFGRVEDVSAETRASWLAAMAALGRRGG